VKNQLLAYRAGAILSEQVSVVS